MHKKIDIKVYKNGLKAVDMKAKFFLGAILLLISSAQTVSAKEPVESFNKLEILKLLADAPYENKLFLKTESDFSPWLIRTGIFDAFNAILQDEALRQDPDIRSRLFSLSEIHPFTDIRASAQLTLSEFRGDRVPPMFHYGRVPDGYKGLTAKQMNESMVYCAPPPNAKQPDFEVEAETDAEALKASGREHVRPQYRFKMPMRYGTVTGGYYSIRGVGLSYEQNAAPHTKVGISHANNRYIMKSDTEDEYWLIDGPHHMIGGASISKLVETEDGIERYLYRVLPSTVSQVFELEDGRIFINFANFDPSKRSGSWDSDVFTPTPLETYNPPIIVHLDGKVSLACTANASKF